jgi:hypothetical protein
VSRYRTLVTAGLDDEERALLGGSEAHEPQVTVDSDADFALCIHRVPEGAAVHLIRYDYDEQADAVPPLERLELTVRLPETFTRAQAFSPAGDLRVTMGDGHRLVLEDVPLYGVVLLSP